jgi:alpha,alpha-trehalose phosphorylase
MKAVGVGTAEAIPSAPECVENYAAIDVQALLDTGRTSRPPLEPWTLAETSVQPGRARYWETVFALGNGYMGLRGTPVEEEDARATDSYPGMFINGIYDYEPYDHVVAYPGYPPHRHAMVNLCDWRIVNLEIDAEPFSLSRGKVSEYRRELDLRRGVVVRTLVWESPRGTRVRIRTTRLVSMERRHCAAIRLEVTPLGDTVHVTFESKFKSKVPSEALKGRHFVPVRQGVDNDVYHFTFRTLGAPFRVGMAFAQELTGRDADTTHFEPEMEGNVLIERFALEAADGETVVLDKYAGFHSTVETPKDELVRSAVADVRGARAAGFEQLLAEQVAWWARYWSMADIEIEGNVADQQAVRFSLFHLRQSHPEDERRSIGANGVTGDKYCGHVFWDTEMYMAPHFLYTSPELVRPLLMYRYNILERARERARQMDGRGALYSWNSISGEECGVVYEASTAEYHLQSDIAWAISKYVEASYDRDFLRDYGAEMLFETARFMSDRGTFIPAKDNKFCINMVCGPDEYGCAVNNNCYTNMLAQWHLRYAAEIYDWMRAECPERFAELIQRIDLMPEERDLWQRAADEMYIPFNETLGIHEQDDEFLYLDPVDMSKVPRYTDIRELVHPLNLWRMQVVKQADVVLLMFVLGEQFSTDIKRANYEFYEPRTCHGSSLSACIHSIVAAEVGKLNGFGGLCDYRDGLRFAPQLPDRWKSYRFKVLYHGSRIAVEVGPDGATYRLLAGGPVEFHSADQPIRLTPEVPEAAGGLQGTR